MTDISVAEIAAMLTDRAPDVCKALDIAGAPKGPRWTCASGFAGPGTQVSIKLAGDKAGLWRDFAGGHGGDMLDLIEAVRGGTKGEAVSWAKALLGISPVTGKQGKKSRPLPPPTDREARRQETRQAAEKKRRGAWDIWQDTVPGDGTGVEGYLYSRGINVAALGGVPKTLCLAPLLKRWQPEFEIVPQMVAAVTDATGHFMTVHATPIMAPGANLMARQQIIDLGPRAGWAGMNFNPKKLVRGPYTGGVIMLGDPGPTWAVGEGIETALAVGCGQPGWSVASSVSVANMVNVPVPPVVEHLVLIGDGDSSPRKDAAGNIVFKDDGSPLVPADETIKRAAAHHAELARAQGRKLSVEIIFAPRGVDFADLAVAQPPAPQVPA